MSALHDDDSRASSKAEKHRHSSKTKTSGGGVEPSTSLIAEAAPSKHKSKKKSHSKHDKSRELAVSSSFDAAAAPATVEDEAIWVCPMCSVAYVEDAADMVGCDGCECWIHWSCVGLTSAPTSEKWFCPMCRAAGNRSKKSKSSKRSR